MPMGERNCRCPLPFVPNIWEGGKGRIIWKGGKGAFGKGGIWEGDKGTSGRGAHYCW